MIRLQLRTPADQTIENVIAHLALAVLESVKRELDSMEVPTENLQTLEVRVQSAIAPFLHAFDGCGKYPVCREGIEGKPVPDIKDHIYLLHLPNGFDPLMEGILTEVQQSIRLGLNREAVEGLNRRLTFSLQRELDRFLYWNPACGQDEVCRTSHPVSPWMQTREH
jgi:hypothetical protein